jgi:hypothetical protein
MRKSLVAALVAGVVFPAVAQQPVATLGPIALAAADVRRLLEAEPPEVRERSRASAGRLPGRGSRSYAGRCADGPSPVAVR